MSLQRYYFFFAVSIGKSLCISKELRRKKKWKFITENISSNSVLYA